MKKALNLLLLITFVLTIMVPLTGVHLHKLASTLFLALCFVHTILYRKQLNFKRYLLLALILLAFLSGLFGMILDHIPLLLILHRCISIGVVFFAAIHIFVFHKKICAK